MTREFLRRLPLAIVLTAAATLGLIYLSIAPESPTLLAMLLLD